MGMYIFDFQLDYEIIYVYFH